MNNKNNNICNINKKYAIIFDMDHTILDNNSCYFLFNLLKEQTVKNIFQTRKSKDLNWIEMMQLIFNNLYDNNIDISTIKNKIKDIPTTKGMLELFEFIHSIKINNLQDNIIDVYILSGSIDLFIECVLNKISILKTIINKHYSYTCKQVNGKLILDKCDGNICSICNQYFCKNKVVKDRIIKENNNIINNNMSSYYSKVYFVGDGDNDYCACLALNNVNSSTAFIREGFYLDKMLYEKENCNELRNKLCCNIVKWRDGYDIINSIKNDIN